MRSCEANTPPTPTPSSRVINTSGTRYHVVRAAAVSVGWRLWDEETAVIVPTHYHRVRLDSAETRASAKDTWDVQWLDKSVLPPRVAGIANYQRVNHFPAMDAIGRKAHLFSRLMSIRTQCQQTISSSAGAGATPVTPSTTTTAPAPAARSRNVLPCRTRVADDVAADLARVMEQFAPRSFLSSRDLPALERYIATHATAAREDSAAPFFIIKPNRSCQGRGIRVSSRPLDVLTAAEHTVAEECLIQVYVDRPLLIDGKKFDLRLYVLLLSVSEPHWPTSSLRTDGAVAVPTTASKVGGDDPLAGVYLFIHEEGLVRICAEPYEVPTEANCRRASVHLTNYAVNKVSSAFRKPNTPEALGGAQGQLTHPTVGDQASEDSEEAEEGGQFNDDDVPCGTARPTWVETGNKRSFHFMRSFVDAATAGRMQWHRDVCRRIDECVALTVLSGLHVLRRGQEASGALRGNKADGRVCFELLGFDVMLREGSCEPVLMEVNHSPSLFCDSAFDFAVKQRVIGDTLRLVDAHLPPFTQRTRGKHGAAAEKTYLTTVRQRWADLEDAQERLVRTGAVGYRQVLPCRRCGIRATPSDDDSSDEQWTPLERRRQEAMATLSAVRST